MLEELKEYVQMGEEIFEHVANDSTIIPSVAKMYRQMYVELTNNGFSHDDAMKIITSFKIGK